MSVRGGLAAAVLAVLVASGAAQGADLEPQPYVPSGQIVADLGFRPKPNGFSFENYGEARTNLTPETMQLLFGKAACRAGSGARCVLHPPARAWLEENNSSMQGGHCMGFSVASLLFFDGKRIKSRDFGAKTTFALRRTPLLESFLAYGWVFQSLDSVQSRTVGGTPAQVLDALIQSMKTRKELYTIGIFLRSGEGGHAVTPVAVELRPDGKYAILVYDNNWPGELRAIILDRTSNTWEYVAATNPDNPDELYDGDAATQSMVLLPTFPGLGTQPCPFCGAATNTYADGPAAKRYDRISLTGDVRNHPRLLITDQRGRRLGFVRGKLVNQIPGARVVKSLFVPVWAGRAEPEYLVPTGLKLEITVDGTGLKRASTSSFTLVTRGRNIVVNGIRLGPGQKAKLVVTSPGAYSYRSDRRQSTPPRLRVGYQGTLTDREFTVRPRRLKGGARLGLSVDFRTGRLKVDSANADGVVYDLEMEVIDEDGSEEFEEEGLEVTDGENDELDYEEWDDDGEEAPVDDVADEDAGEEEEEEEEEEEPRRIAALSGLF